MNECHELLSFFKLLEYEYEYDLRVIVFLLQEPILKQSYLVGGEEAFEIFEIGERYVMVYAATILDLFFSLILLLQIFYQKKNKHVGSYKKPTLDL